MNLVDTSGWIEYFFGASNSKYFTPPIEDVDNLMVSVICVYEVFKKINAVADEAQALQAVAQMRQGSIVDVSEDIALSAALISLKHAMPMADSLIFATAKARGAALWTQDDHFRDLPDVNYRRARSKGSSVRGKPRR